MTEELVTITVQGSRRTIAALDSPQLLYLLVDVRPPEGVQIEKVPLNICLVIDRSTSMDGNRLNKVKTAAGLLIEKLTEDDTISVVAFSDRAEVIVSSSRVQNRAPLIAQISSIAANGGTEIFQGLSAGVNELRRIPLDDSINHLILLTDGQTYGDAEACLSLASEAATNGIGISAFGIGNDWNDEFLDSLVIASGGQSGYIDSPNQLFESLQNKIQGLGSVYAPSVNLSTVFPIGVSLKTSFKVSPYAQPLRSKTRMLKLGAVEEQTPLTVLLELSLEPQLPGRDVLIPLELEIDIPAKAIVSHKVKESYLLTVVIDDPVFKPPKPILDAVRALNLYRMNEQVWDDVGAGNLQDATLRMRRLTTRLIEAGHADLARQAQTETERLATLGALSMEGRKSLKYGTRSLLSSTIAFDE